MKFSFPLYLKIAVGEVLLAFLSPEDGLGCGQNCRPGISVTEPRRDFHSILRGRLVGTAPTALKSVYEAIRKILDVF